MSDVDIDHLKSWIGRERTVEDIITPRLAASLNAVLDIEAPVQIGAPAPVGIHWCLAPDIVPMRGIGPDGHPARGGFLPPVPFPRRMWAGGELKSIDRLLTGDTVSRHSVIEDVVLKTGRSGEMIFVAVRHSYATARGPAIEERQDIVYRKLELISGSAPPAPSVPAAQERAHVVRAIPSDPVLLFRYSAITFNGHRIHYDRPYVTGEEHYPGLIFHGPLQATLLLALATEQGGGNLPTTFAFRAVHPLFAGGTPHIHVRQDGDELALWLTDDTGNVTMKASA